MSILMWYFFHVYINVEERVYELGCIECCMCILCICKCRYRYKYVVGKLFSPKHDFSNIYLLLHVLGILESFQKHNLWLRINVSNSKITKLGNCQVFFSVSIKKSKKKRIWESWALIDVGSTLRILYWTGLRMHSNQFINLSLIYIENAKTLSILTLMDKIV